MCLCFSGKAGDVFCSVRPNLQVIKIMLAVILKDLRYYVNSRKYRRIQFIVLCALAFVLFIATVEFYAHRRMVGTIDVGKQTYILFVVTLFVIQFLVPRYAVEALYMEREDLKTREQNGAFLALTPLSSWEILSGKWIAVVLWATWSILLMVPLFALSSYIGGLTLSQWMKCGMVLLMSCIFFALVGISIALWASPTQAKGISYGIVLFITCLPFIPSSLFETIPMLAAMSPLRALLSILGADSTNLWVWNIGLFLILSALIFPVLVKRIRYLI